MATMPNLTNFHLPYAMKQLGDMRVRWRITYQAVSAPYASGMVLSQSPSAGSVISGIVSLTVSVLSNSSSFFHVTNSHSAGGGPD